MQRFERHEGDLDSERLWACIEALKRQGGPGADALNGRRKENDGPIPDSHRKRAAECETTRGSDAPKEPEIETLLPLAAALYKVMQAEATSGQSAARARLNAVIQADIAEAGPQDLPLTFDPRRAVVAGPAGPHPDRVVPGRLSALFAPMTLRGVLVALVLLILALAAVGGLYTTLNTPEPCHPSPARVRK